MASMRDRVTIGQQWERKRGRTVGRVRMVHRADRLVELVTTEGRSCVPFSELRRYWRLVAS